MKDCITYRVLATRDLVYTFPKWPTKEIDGVKFISVVRRMPSQDLTQETHFMRLDALEKVKTDFKGK
jgi:hypothetical protein